MFYNTKKSVLETLLSDNPELNIPVHDYNINVTSNNGGKLDAVQTFSEFQRFDGAQKDTHLYLHLPLCDYICHFCNYVKQRVKSRNKNSELAIWADLLIKESQLYLDQVPWVRQANITSFYIGGGTGALLLNNADAIARIVEHVKSNYNVAANCEFSIEGNPENFTDATVALAQRLGFNRFSVGVQSLQDEVNDFSNRLHTRSDALKAIEVLKATKLPFSVDMMFGLPFQSLETVRKDIQCLIDKEVPAITIYRLRNSDRESMGIGNASVWNSNKYKHRLDSKNLLPDVVEVYHMRDAITQLLRENNYHPSPCGWWNKEGTYPGGNIPRVSQDKWEHYNTMLALGPGAYGWLSGGQRRAIQTHNRTNISDYMAYMAGKISLPPLAFGRILEDSVAIATRLAFAYKANQPIFVDDYSRQFGINLLSEEPYAGILKALQRKDLIRLCHDERSYFIPTWKGEELHEEIMYVYFHKMIGASSQALCQHVSPERQKIEATQII